MNRSIISFLLLFLFSAVSAETPVVETNDDSAFTADELAQIEHYTQLGESLDPQHGQLELLNGVVTLNVPENFYFLDAKDSQTVLVDMWGNPPSPDTLGMLFPAGSNPLESTAWGVTIEYIEDGYVSDEDADDIDYAKMLKQMQEETESANEYRVEQGYQPIQLVGWAAQPYYDQSAKKLHWAKELRFGTDDVNTLNYNIRVLGRKGVLLLNFVAGIDQLDDINRELDNVMAIAEFNPGSRYADFDPDIDEVAAYGIGALVAGKVLAKTGFLAVALLFLKKFGIWIIVALGALASRLFKRKSEQ